jgi:hypothetical protein
MSARVWWVWIVAACRFGFDDVPQGGRDGSLASEDGVLADTSADASDGAASSDALSVVGCTGATIFCDGFESGDLSRWSSLYLSGAGTSGQVVTSPVHSGMYAFEGRMPNTGSNGAAAAKLMIPAQSTGMLVVREWINLAVPLEHFDLVVNIQNATQSSYTAVGGNTAGDWVTSEARPATNAIDHHSTIATPPINTWTCVELVFMFGATPHHQVYVNETLVIDTDAITPNPTFEVVLAGAVRADQLGFDVFIDDVIVSNARIGCQ